MYFRLSQALSEYYGLVCAVTFCNSWKTGLYTHTVLVVIVGLYTFESRNYKFPVELPNITEGL